MATPPDFTTAQILTSAAMNAVGLWLVKAQSVTAGSSTTAVTGAFNADYDAYKIIVTNGSTSSANTNVDCVMGATVTGYDNGGIFFGPSSTGGLGGTNQGSFTFAGEGTTNYIFSNFELQNPFLAKHTLFTSLASYNTANGNSRINSGVLTNTTSYTDFSLKLSGGATFSTGTIRVYGYRK